MQDGNVTPDQTAANTGHEAMLDQVQGAFDAAHAAGESNQPIVIGNDKSPLKTTIESVGDASQGPEVVVNTDSWSTVEGDTASSKTVIAQNNTLLPTGGSVKVEAKKEWLNGDPTTATGEAQVTVLNKHGEVTGQVGITPDQAIGIIATQAAEQVTADKQTPAA